jgi:hypothetical protein
MEAFTPTGMTACRRFAQCVSILVSMGRRCHSRILRSPWCESLAQGHQFFDLQRYRARQLNSTNFCDSGVYIVFGLKQSAVVAGVGLVSGPATQCCTMEYRPPIESWVPQEPPVVHV